MWRRGQCTGSVHCLLTYLFTKQHTSSSWLSTTPSKWWQSNSSWNHRWVKSTAVGGSSRVPLRTFECISLAWFLAWLFLPHFCAPSQRPGLRRPLSHFPSTDDVYHRPLVYTGPSVNSMCHVDLQSGKTAGKPAATNINRTTLRNQERDNVNWFPAP